MCADADSEIARSVPAVGAQPVFGQADGVAVDAQGAITDGVERAAPKPAGLDAGEGAPSPLLARLSTGDPGGPPEDDRLPVTAGQAEAWLRRMVELTAASGINNIVPVHLPIVDGWYDASRVSLPGHFALGLNDGPPRTVGSRMGFFKHFGTKAETIISDDAGDFGYATALTAWANDNGKRIDFIERAALMRPKAA